MSAVLALMTASVLGALAFFEPCTIATHTLFSVRAHAQRRSACCQGLFMLWGARSALSVGLLMLAVSLIDAPHWNSVVPGVMLAAMASVYLASRFFYIPVPHLAFYKLLPQKLLPHKLLPGGERLPQALQLGLTLPACTLPLFAIVAALVVTLDSMRIAVLAGLLFASLFTLPTAIAAVTGFSARGRRFLQFSAVATPFITAALLYGAALYFGMDR